MSEVCPHNRVKSQCEICNPTPIAIKIDTSRIDKKLSELEQKLEGSSGKSREELEEEVENLKGTLEMIADKAFDMHKKQKMNENPEIASEIAECDNPEDLEKIIQRHKTGRAEGKGAAGTAWLNEAQRSGRTEKGYSSYGAMLKDLRKRERLGDVEAKRILEELFRKARTLKGLSTEPSKEERKVYHEPSVSEQFYKVKKKGKGED